MNGAALRYRMENHEPSRFEARAGVASSGWLYPSLGLYHAIWDQPVWAAALCGRPSGPLRRKAIAR